MKELILTLKEVSGDKQRGLFKLKIPIKEIKGSVVGIITRFLNEEKIKERMNGYGGR